MKLKNFVKSLAGVFENFDVYVSLFPELLSSESGATDYKYKNRLTGGFIGKNLATNRKYTQVTIFVYIFLKTLLKSEDQSFRRRCSSLREKFDQTERCQIYPNFGRLYKKMASLLTRNSQTRTINYILASIFPWNQTVKLTVKEIYHINNYRIVNLRSKLRFLKFPNFLRSSKLSNITNKTRVELAEVPRSFNSGPPGPGNHKQKMRFQFNIENNTFLKIEKYLKYGLKDPEIKLKFSSTNFNQEGKDKQTLKINFILIRILTINITGSGELQIPPVEQLIGEEPLGEARPGGGESLSGSKTPRQSNQAMAGNGNGREPHRKTPTSKVADSNEASEDEVEKDRVEREQWLGAFPSGYPPYPTPFTKEEQAYWDEWVATLGSPKADQTAASDKSNEEMEEDMELEHEMDDILDASTVSDESITESASVSAKPAAEPKAEGRCMEGAFCQNVADKDHSCVYDTESTVSSRSAESASIKCYGLSREGEDRPFTPPPHQNFTLDDLNLVIGQQHGQDGSPSIVWTNASVLSTLASVLETEPSVVSTMPSIVSTSPSIMVVDEIDLRYTCQCGVQMGPQEQAATLEFLSRFPAPYVCLNCRWRSAGL